MTFKVGDKAVHPKHGVGDVLAIEDKEIAGHKMTMFVLEIAHDQSQVMVSTAAAERLGLRHAITKERSDVVMEVIGRDEVSVTAQPWIRRERAYNELLYSGKPTHVARVMRDIYRLKFKKDLSIGERQLLKTAMNFLIPELAYARGTDNEGIMKEIEDMLGKHEDA